VARHGLTRPAGEIHPQEPPDHHRWERSRLTGALNLALEIPQDQFVSPSTGRLTLTRKGGMEVVAQEAARAAATPVIPGSGIKGAVRNLYELLSFSCDPFSRSCNANSCCDACSLFGILGRSGRVGFDDARPAEPGSVRVEVREVPMPWLPRKPEGDVSFYDFEEAKQLDKARGKFVTSPKELSREVFLGTFETRMNFWNATPEELGRLLFCMGIGTDETTRFFLRLGGVKYDGKGAVTVRPRALLLASPSRKSLQGDEAQRETAGWLETAGSSEWARTFWPKLEEVAKLLRGAA
jgi:hypothetical protein